MNIDIIGRVTVLARQTGAAISAIPRDVKVALGAIILITPPIAIAWDRYNDNRKHEIVQVDTPPSPRPTDPPSHREVVCKKLTKLSKQLANQNTKTCEIWDEWPESLKELVGAAIQNKDSRDDALNACRLASMVAVSKGPKEYKRLRASLNTLSQATENLATRVEIPGRRAATSIGYSTDMAVRLESLQKKYATFLEHQETVAKEKRSYRAVKLVRTLKRTFDSVETPTPEQNLLRALKEMKAQANRLHTIFTVAYETEQILAKK